MAIQRKTGTDRSINNLETPNKKIKLFPFLTDKEEKLLFIVITHQRLLCKPMISKTARSAD